MVFMRFTKSLHIANDGYGGINIQVEIKLKKKEDRRISGSNPFTFI